METVVANLAYFLMKVIARSSKVFYTSELTRDKSESIFHKLNFTGTPCEMELFLKSKEEETVLIGYDSKDSYASQHAHQATIDFLDCNHNSIYVVTYQVPKIYTVGQYLWLFVSLLISIGALVFLFDTFRDMSSGQIGAKEVISMLVALVIPVACAFYGFVFSRDTIYPSELSTSLESCLKLQRLDPDEALKRGDCGCA